MSVLKISELITELQSYQRRYGDLPLSTWDGFIHKVFIDPVNDGVRPIVDEKPNELSLDIRTE